MTDSPTSQAMHLAMTELKERAERIAELEEALRQIVDMDIIGLRADDLGKAVRIARAALARSVLNKQSGGAADNAGAAVAAAVKDLAALQSTLRFIDEKVKPRRCDSDGVSGCWRCQSVYLAARMRELLAERDEVGINGLTEAETNATASVMGIVGATLPQSPKENDRA